jgi:hypothetical protein
MKILRKLGLKCKNFLWALTVAFMLGVHNFYKGETKSKDDIVSHIEHHLEAEDDAPLET